MVLRKIFLFIFFIVFSCESHRLPTNPVEYFKGISALKTETVCCLDSFGIYNPNSLVCSGDRFFMQGDGLEVLLELNTFGHTKNVITVKGNGPNELLNITNLSLSGNSIILAECNKKKLVELDLTGTSTDLIFTDLPGEYGSFTSVVRSGDLIIATGLFEPGRYLCYNLANNAVSFFGSYPSESGKVRNPDNLLASNVYLSSKLAISPDNSHFACVHYNSGTLDINEITNDSIINSRLLAFHYPATVEKRRGDDIRVAIKNDNVNGFFDVTASNKYIYALYSGKTFEDAGVKLSYCDYLMVFDWEGNPVECYHMDIPLSLIAYNQTDNVLYGIGINDNTELLRLMI